MKLRTSAVLSVGLVIVCLVSGCASEQTGRPHAQPTGAGQSGSESAGGGGDSSAVKPSLAPPVPKPLNVGLYLDPKNICLILGLPQLHKLGMREPTSGGGEASPYGPTCAYGDHGKGASGVVVGFQPKFSLEDAYERRNDWPYFEPGEVQGYPLVTGTAGDARKDGRCTVHLAVTNSISSDIQFSETNTRNGEKACDLARKTADEVVTTLKKTK